MVAQRHIKSQEKLVRNKEISITTSDKRDGIIIIGKNNYKEKIKLLPNNTKTFIKTLINTIITKKINLGKSDRIFNQTLWPTKSRKADNSVRSVMSGILNVIYRRGKIIAKIITSWNN